MNGNYCFKTRQSLPTPEYCELLGISLSVFCSNLPFIIEIFLNYNNKAGKYNWYQLIDEEAGNLKKIKGLKSFFGNEIFDLFFKIVAMRNRIVHSFRITNANNEQSLATKELIKDGNTQFEITEEYLKEFISENEKLALLLDDFREKQRSK